MWSKFQKGDTTCGHVFCMRDKKSRNIISMSEACLDNYIDINFDVNILTYILLTINKKRS